MPNINITFKQYVLNPTMQSNSVLNLSMIRKQLDNRYDQLINKHKKFEYNVYKNKNTYYIHMRQPSESYGLKYDVVFEIVPGDNKYVKDCTFRVFSNSPSFVYTYAYIFNLYGLLIPQLKDKFDEVVLTREPSIRNYFKIISYEKSLYYSMLFLLNENQTIADLEKKVSKRLSIDKAFNTIKTDSEKVLEYKLVKRKETMIRKRSVTKTLAHKIERELKKNVNPSTIRNTHSIKAKEKITGHDKVTAKKKIKGRKKR